MQPSEQFSDNNPRSARSSQHQSQPNILQSQVSAPALDLLSQNAISEPRERESLNQGSTYNRQGSGRNQASRRSSFQRSHGSNQINQSSRQHSLHQRSLGNRQASLMGGDDASVEQVSSDVKNHIMELTSLIHQDIGEEGQDTFQAMLSQSAKILLNKFEDLVLAQKDATIQLGNQISASNQDHQTEQEQFFRLLQERDDQIQMLQLENKDLQKQPQGLEPPPEEVLSYEEEEAYSKKRRQLQFKYLKSSNQLQELIEKQFDTQALLNIRVEAVQLVEDMNACMREQNQENKSLQMSRIKQDSKVKALQENIKFLEARMSQTLIDSEEKTIKLMSSNNSYKNKAAALEKEIKDVKFAFETQNASVLNQKVEQAKQEYLDTMNQIQKENEELSTLVHKLKGENRELGERVKEFEKEYVDAVKEKDDIIGGLEQKLSHIDTKYVKKLTKMGTKKEETQKKLNIEEKEREMFGLKLEQVMVNNKKLLLQKKFLEKQLEKDLREIHLEMNKIQIEIQQDQLMNSNAALQRFKTVYLAVSDQLTYIQQIVGFMDFDAEGVPGTRMAPTSAPQTFDEIAKEINDKFPQQSRKEDPHSSPSSPEPRAEGEYPASTQFSGNQLGGSIQSQTEPLLDGTLDVQNQASDQFNMSPNNADNLITQAQQLQFQQRQQQQQQASARAAAQAVQRTQIGVGGFGNGQTYNLSMEECLTSYPNETVLALMEVILDNFKDAKIHQSEEMIELYDLAQSRADRGIVNDFTERYLTQKRVQLSQFIYKLQEKCKSLEIERKNLQFKVQRAKMDLKKQGDLPEEPVSATFKQGSVEETELEGLKIISQADDSFHTTDDKMKKTFQTRDSQPMTQKSQMDEDPEQEGFTRSQRRSKDTSGVFMGDHDAEAQSRPTAKAGYSELENQNDFLKQLNVALKERCKEIRLNLQRKITELQDTLTISKQKYMTEMSELKVEYGKDLNRITRTSKERQAELEKQFDSLKEEELEQLHKEFDQKEAELKDNILENEKRAKEAIEQAEINVRDAERDLKKLKNESTGYFKGGWGTFILAFEDEDSVKVMLEKKQDPNSSSLSLSMSSPQSKTRKATAKITLTAASTPEKEKSAQKLSSRSNSSTKDFGGVKKELSHPHPIEKIQHFIEVGFLIDSNNFRLLNTYDEDTYDSQLKKYLYELQDPIDNFMMNDLEFKVKQQLSDNVGLFNEINPVYISLNMGRPSTPFFDDYIPQEHFRLIKREGIYLMGNRWMMINFLKCDYLSQQDSTLMHPNISITSNDTNEAVVTQKKPHDKYLLRVIAFENSTSAQFSFDLNYNDLLTLMHGNLKLLENENSHDLCQIILNNLSLIQREKVDKRGNPIFEDVLIVEHKIFFNEHYRAVYDKNNKKIMAKYDKKRQGLVRDMSLSTEFEKSVIYEAYEPVFSEDVFIASTQKGLPGERASVEILRGTMSKNIKLKAAFKDGTLEKEIVFFAKDQQRSHKLCTEIIHVNSPESQTLAFVISLEKIYGQEDVLVVRLVVVEKTDYLVMSDYDWSVEGRPQEGSTTFNSETLYLMKKNDQIYCRVYEYEILNTEVRTLLFMHSFGYFQTNVDFGNVRRFFELAEDRHLKYLSQMNHPEALERQLNVIIREPAQIEDFKGMTNLIFRQFYFIRVRFQNRHQSSLLQHDDSMTNVQSRINNFMEPSNTGNQASVVNKKSTFTQLTNEIQNTLATSEDFKDLQNYTALVTFLEDGYCLDKGHIIVKVVIQDLEVDFTQHVLVPKEIMKKPDLLSIVKPAVKVDFSLKLLDKLVLTETTVEPDGENQDMDASEIQEDQKIFQLQLEKDILPMSQVISEAKRLEFEQILRHEESRHDDDVIDLEITDIPALQLTLAGLAACQKASTMTLINQKLHKVTAYFVEQQRGFKPKTEARMFDWLFVYLEVAQRNSDQMTHVCISERDLVSLLQKLKQKWRVERKQLGSEILAKSMSRQAILDLILDSMLLDEAKNSIRLSMIQLDRRFRERQALEDRFILTGGRFIKLLDGRDPDLADFQTTLPETELSEKMLINVQKDMSDKTFDVKILELALKSFPGAKKIRFEIFWVEEPDIVFRCDVFSNDEQDGTQMIIEKINIVEQLEYIKHKGKIEDYDPSKFAKDGLVLAICESNFPHQISFMMIEPCSHIQWEYAYHDSKVNVIETRQQRLNFVYNLHDSLDRGILRDVFNRKRSLKISPGEQEFVGEDQLKDTYYVMGPLDGILDCQRTNNERKLIYQQSVMVDDDIFMNLIVFSDEPKGKIVLRLAPIEDDRPRATTPDSMAGKTSLNHSMTETPSSQAREVHVSAFSQMEGSRVFSGCITFLDKKQSVGMSSHQKNLIYTVELACAQRREEIAIRVSLFNQKKQSPLVSVVFAERSMFEDDNSMREETKFGLASGFTDSLSVLQKLSYLNYDFKNYEMQQQFTNTNRKQTDLMKDFREGGEGTIKDSREDERALSGVNEVKDHIIKKALKDNVLLFRRVLNIERSKKSILISVLREINPLFNKEKADFFKTIDHDPFLIKIILFENRRVVNKMPGLVTSNDQPITERSAMNHQTSKDYPPARSTPNHSHMGFDEAPPTQLSGGTQKQSVQSNLQVSQEYIFVFRLSEVFSPDELRSKDLFDIRGLKKMVTGAVNRRLRIREIPDFLNSDLNRNTGVSSMTKKMATSKTDRTIETEMNAKQGSNYVAFFLNAEKISVMEPRNPAVERVDLLEGRKQFDIRKLHSYSLVEPAEKVEKDEFMGMKHNLIYQFEKDDLLYEVFEILSPTELTFRFKVYNRLSFSMLTSSDIMEGDLKEQLIKDKRSYLASPQQREEMARYVITNSFFDEKTNSLKFLVSNLIEEI